MLQMDMRVSQTGDNSSSSQINTFDRAIILREEGALVTNSLDAPVVNYNG